MFYERRMKNAHKQQTKADKVELKQNIELLVPAAANKEKVLLNVVEKAKLKTKAKQAKAAAYSAFAETEMED